MVATASLPSAWCSTRPWKGDATPAAVPPTAGAYTIVTGANPGAGDFAQGIFRTFDAQCQSDLHLASAGQVTVSEIDLSASGRATGTFDLSFGTDILRGAFDAPLCDLPGGQVTCP